jgi:GTPase
MAKNDDELNKITSEIDNIFAPEKDDGNIEYKWKLVNLTDNRIEKLTTQMRYRIAEGSGEALYEIGVADDGFPKGVNEGEYEESFNNLKKLAEKCDATCSLITKKEVANKLLIAEILVRKKVDTGNYIDLSIVVAGNVDAAKSSTIGVLISGNLDNGRGLSRSNVFNYKHEVETGRTSSVAHQIMGFRDDSSIVNENRLRKMTWPEIVAESAKIITFYDLAGHEKYLRTTIYGFSSTYPDYAMIMIGANMGITQMTKEHISLCLTYKIPFFVIFSKIDIAPKEVFDEIKRKFNLMMKSPGLRKIPIQIKTEEDVVLSAKNMLNENIVPYMEISNVTGENVNILKKFLNFLPQRKNYKKYEAKPVEFTIDEKYSITGIGTVVAGVLHQGIVKVNDNVYIGPDSTGLYRKTQVKSIHFKRVPVQEARAGGYYCFNVKKITKPWVRRGMAVIGAIEQPRTVWRFEAEVSILQSHHTTIKKGYEPNIHINNISQVCLIEKIERISTKKGNKYDDEDENSPILRAGDQAIVSFKFKYRPEFIKDGYKVIFRENRVRGIGIISQIYPIIKN